MYKKIFLTLLPLLSGCTLTITDSFNANTTNPILFTEHNVTTARTYIEQVKRGDRTFLKKKLYP
jgi:hypothetical protein